MSREEAIKVEGTVSEVLPNHVFRVVLPNGHRTLAHISGKARKEVVRVASGDRVVVEMSPYDLSRGCITCRQEPFETGDLP